MITWMGKPLDKLTREELYNIIKELHTKYMSLLSPIESRARALGKVEMIKRGEN